MRLVRIVAPHFVAGLEILHDVYNVPYCAKAAPIIKYMRGKTLDWITAYCQRKNWHLEQL